ncbi:uncharacterized protein LOC119831347 [Zerene cesonia]|uniref:uncharacterized protein LOC119831347 n=1 Tax=Zerene cesonia TaxID=33412 RepID=UPI0018E4FDA9|nr:uncharacterized protein LOC119831347 [Zerene cesonia]
MNPLNIAEWSPDQVAEWMSGLGPMVAQYAPELLSRGVNGTKLLTLRCDDLEYLGIRIIGHQELLLEAVEHLRNFHYEISRECVQQLALRVSAAAASLARALRHHADTRLETHSLADVARTVQAVKPLVCWLDRWPLCSGAPLAERKAALLKLSLEAATCAQRDRFAEQPARAVAAAAAAAAATADYIIQDVSDPMILQPAWVDTVSLKQGGRALGFQVVPSFCGHHQLAHIRFGSPAHASGHVHEGDEIVQVGNTCFFFFKLLDFEEGKMPRTTLAEGDSAVLGECRSSDGASLAEPSTMSPSRPPTASSRRPSVSSRRLLGAGSGSPLIGGSSLGSVNTSWMSCLSARADCMIYLEGCTVSAAGEVKSRAHAFKVYHTGTAVYFAAASRDAMLAWIQLVHRATLLPPTLPANTDFKQFSETDYSDTESETESSERREKDREKEKEKEKDKSKFGSLKKLTQRSGRSESQENVSQPASSLDRKYLRFFSRAKAKDDPKNTKNKQSIPTPTEQYRSLDFEKSDFVARPSIQPRPKHKPEKLVGFVTLEEFMLKKQEEERRQVYSERVLLGVTERRELQRRLDRIVPDVIYGELDPPHPHAHSHSHSQPHSRPAGDGYEKIVFPDERTDNNRQESFRKKEKVHLTTSNSGQTQTTTESSGGASVSRLRLMFGGRQEEGRARAGQYPHLQCPPTFQPETYSLARLAPPPAPP